MCANGVGTGVCADAYVISIISHEPVKPILA